MGREGSSQPGLKLSFAGAQASLKHFNHPHPVRRLLGSKPPPALIQSALFLKKRARRRLKF